MRSYHYDFNDDPGMTGGLYHALAEKEVGMPEIGERVLLDSGADGVTMEGVVESVRDLRPVSKAHAWAERYVGSIYVRGDESTIKAT